MKTIACGNKAHQDHQQLLGMQPHHRSVAEVRRCFATEGGLYTIEEEEHADTGDYLDDPDAAYELHLETRYSGDPEYDRDLQFLWSSAPIRPEGDIDTIEEEQADDSDPDPLLGDVLLDGTYTIEGAAGGGHRTFRLKTQSEDSKFAPGSQVAAYLSGPDNTNDYTSFAFIDSKRNRANVWKKYQGNADLVADINTLLDDPRAALVSGACFACGRALTTPESLALGLGEVCARKAGA